MLLAGESVMRDLRLIGRKVYVLGSVGYLQ